MKLYFKLIRLTLAFVLMSMPFTSSAKNGGPAYSGHSPIGLTYFSFADFKAALLTNASKNVAEGVALLPAEFKNNFTLMHSGMALQQSSYQYPRAILFGETGHLVLTFNGHPSQRGYDSIETVEFDEVDKRVKYRAVQFKSEKSKNTTNFDKQEIEFENDKVIITKANPKTCLQCHVNNRTKDNFEDSTSLARYIWDEYPKWPGAFTSEDRTDSFNQEDLIRYKALKKRLATEPRYRNIFSTPAKIDSSFPFNDDDTYLGKNEMNTALTSLISTHYAFQMADFLKKNGVTPKTFASEKKNFFEDSIISLKLNPSDELKGDIEFKKLTKHEPNMPAQYASGISGLDYLINYFMTHNTAQLKSLIADTYRCKKTQLLTDKFYQGTPERTNKMFIVNALAHPTNYLDVGCGRVK